MSKLIVAREIFATLSWLLIPTTISFLDWLIATFLKEGILFHIFP